MNISYCHKVILHQRFSKYPKYFRNFVEACELKNKNELPSAFSKNARESLVDLLNVHLGEIDAWLVHGDKDSYLEFRNEKEEMLFILRWS